MAKVAILVPYQEMCEMARPLMDEYRYIEIMCLEYIQTEQVESRARKLEEDGCELIVARGVHAGIIEHSVKVPLVEIRVTAQELGMVMLDIKQQLGLLCPRIGLLGFSNVKIRKRRGWSGLPNGSPSTTRPFCSPAKRAAAR